MIWTILSRELKALDAMTMEDMNDSDHELGALDVMISTG